MNAEPTDITLKNTWTWWPFAFLIGMSAFIFYVTGLNTDSIETAAALIVILAYAVLVQFRYRVRLTDEGIAIRAWRHRFIPRGEVEAIEVRRSFLGRRLTVIRTDGTSTPLPVPWWRDTRWNEMVNQAQEWGADSQHNGLPERSG